MSSPNPKIPPRPRLAGRGLGVGLAICALFGSPGLALGHGVAPDASVAPPQTHGSIRVHTPTQGAWPDAVTSIEFELAQAGYAVALDATTSASATLIVAYDGEHGWVLSLEDSIRDVRLEARGSRDASPQVVGLHAVEMIHASRLDLPKPARRAPTRPMTAEHQHPQHPPPSPPVRPASDPTSWALDIGVTTSNVGLLGPRLGVAHRWAHTELSFAMEAGFFSNDQQHGAQVGLGSLRRPTGLGSAWTTHRPTTVLRSGLAAAYVFRAGRELRPSLGISSNVIAPLVDTEFVQSAPFHRRTQLGYGLAWVPALEVGARLSLSPKLAVRGSIRAGPTVTFKEVPIVESSQTIAFPNGVAMASLSLLFGRNAGSNPR